MSNLRKTIIDSKRDWNIKLTAALWAYGTSFKVTTYATPFSLLFGIEGTLFIEFEVELLRVAVGTHLNDSQSLRYKLIDLEELDEERRRVAQHIEAIQRRRKTTFNKRNKMRALQPCMMVMIQDARKLDFPGKFDALWLGPYLVRETFPNNSLQLETLNGRELPNTYSWEQMQAIQGMKTTYLQTRDFGSQFHMVANYMSPIWDLIYVFSFRNNRI